MRSRPADQRHLVAEQPELDVFVTEFTGGNAFFVLQYAALLAARPRGEEFDPAALDLPLGVKFVLLQRFGQLPETVRAIVWALCKNIISLI